MRNPVPQLQQIAKQAGFTEKTFDECLKDQKLYNDILAMRERGSKEYKVESTPTLFVNGKMQKGGATIEELDKADRTRCCRRADDVLVHSIFRTGQRRAIPLLRSGLRQFILRRNSGGA